jgi:UDPglucose 6-dehydrogenase
MDMEGVTDNITCYKSAKEAVDGAHAVTIMTEWDEFKMYDWQDIYDIMQKPAFVFDGRNILDHEHLKEIGFIVYALGQTHSSVLEIRGGAIEEWSRSNISL